MENNFAQEANRVFGRAVADYHIKDDVDSEFPNPYPAQSVEAVLYDKCIVDSVQWHLEDIIRDPQIDPVAALALKRRIDASNQVRTDMVEEIDSYFLNLYADVPKQPGASINTESPAWAIDRLSILALKIWHMREQAQRPNAAPDHRTRCAAKLHILLQQREDLIMAINDLLAQIAAGHKYMKVYRQMKMYNDPATNPVLYGQKK